MRNISVFVTLAIVWVMVFPQTALANGGENTDTKIKFKVGLVQPDKNERPIPYNHAQYVPVDQNTTVVKRFVANISAYTAAADECGKSDGITASGKMVKENRTIACPREFKFGTKIRIQGKGTYICEDRGGAIKINKLDIYMKTKSEAFKFGRRNLIAEVVK